MADSTTSTSPFLDIPSELRLRIYELLFDLAEMKLPQRSRYGAEVYHPDGSDTPAINAPGGSCHISIDYNRVSKGNYPWLPARTTKQPTLDQYAAILRTCQLVNNEATDVLYDQTLFVFHLMHGSRTIAADHSLGDLNSCSFLGRVRHAHFLFKDTTDEGFKKVPRAVTRVLRALGSDRVSTITRVRLGDPDLVTRSHPKFLIKGRRPTHFADDMGTVGTAVELEVRASNAGLGLEVQRSWEVFAALF